MSAGRPQLCYISAASHSGSTLLAMLLNAHPDICTIGELKLSNIGDTQAYRCSCRRLISECEFWRNLVSRMSTGDKPFELTKADMHLGDLQSAYARRLLRPLHRGPGMELLREALLGLSPTWRRELPAWQDRNRRLLDAIGDVSGCGVVVDSSKIGVRLKYLLRTPGIDVRVLKLVRDGRAVALTYMDAFRYADARDREMRGGGTGAQEHKDLPMSAAAREWRRSNEEARAVLSRVDSDRYLQVRYEDLCADVSGTLGRIVEFIGLGHSEEYRRFKEVEHHVVGNGMRLDGSSEVVLDDRWKQVLDRSNLEEFERVAGAMNRSFGYT